MERSRCMQAQPSGRPADVEAYPPSDQFQRLVMQQTVLSVSELPHAIQLARHGMWALRQSSLVHTVTP
jgi:hypothetical protein